MKVTIADVANPDKTLDSDFPFEPSLGVPAVGDVIHLRNRDNARDQRRVGTVIRREWWAVANEPHYTEVCLLIDVTRR